MATRPTLPYFAPSGSLPAALPTVADILSAKHIFPTSDNCTVVRMREHFVVKYGKSVRLQEAENMLFVQQATNVPVPTVYAAFHDEGTGYNFIVQEYIPGEDLKSCWKSLERKDKEAMCAQLRQYFDELRSLPQPEPGYFGGVWRQPVLDLWMTGAFYSDRDTTVGPFDNEEQWVDAMLRSGQFCHEKTPVQFDLLKHIYHSVFRNHNKPVFTHGDLDQSNIRVRDDKTLVLIDWEWSGWYPGYWEYCLVTETAGGYPDNDWPLWTSYFLDEYIAELGWMAQFRAWTIYDG